MFGLGFMVGALIGLGYALYINYDWYKECVANTKFWTDYVMRILDDLTGKNGDTIPIWNYKDGDRE